MLTFIQASLPLCPLFIPNNCITASISHPIENHAEVVS
jgi:hypothetical protein